MWPFSSSYESLCVKGLRAVASGNFEAAEELLRRAARLDPMKAEAYAGLGWVYQAYGWVIKERGDQAASASMWERSAAVFDDAASREIPPGRRAKYLFEKGVSLDLLGRAADRDAAWKAAEALREGIVREFKSRSAWLDEHKCERCGKTFCFRDHGDANAWRAAEHLRWGKKYDDDRIINWISLGGCPACGQALAEDAFRKVAKELGEKLKK
jgi:tetratricopeptide (TPR) repeat protein